MIGKIRFRSACLVCASGLAAGACAVYDGSLLLPDVAQGGSAGDITAGATQSDALGGDSGLIAGGGATTNVGGANSAGDAPAAAGDAGETENGGAPAAAGASSGGHGGSVGGAGNAGNGGSGGALGAGAAGASAGGTAGALEGGAGASGGVATGGASAGGASAGGAGGDVGNAGSGGAVGSVACADHPFSLKSTWLASASHQSTTPKNPPSCLVDGANTRWSSGKPQSGDEWVQIDFGVSVSLRGINLQQGADTNDYPRSYAVIVSDTKNDLTGAVRVSGAGTGGVTTTITLPKVFSGRYLLIKQLGSSLSWWSVAEVEPSCTDG